MKNIEGDIIYIEATKSEMENLVKLYQVGAIPKTIARYANMTITQALTFIRMARTGSVRYLSEGEIKSFTISNIASQNYIKNDIENEWVSEDDLIYGGTLGAFPEFKVLWKNEMTIKEYLTFKKDGNGINEKIVHRHNKQREVSRS